MDAEALTLRAVGEPVRLRLLVLLCQQGETCVRKLAEALAAPEFTISRHLGVLRAAGLVRARREGTWMHYALAAPRTSLEKFLHTCFRECFKDHPVAKADLARLKRLERSGGKGTSSAPGDSAQPAKR